MMEPRVSIPLNLVWILSCSFLVMFMQVGFAMMETGLTRSKNAVNTMAMNLLVYPVGVIGFWLTGYGIMLGGAASWSSLGPSTVDAHEVSLTWGARSFGLFGAAKYCLVSVSHDPASMAMFLYAVVFMDTAATIPTGALAERWRFVSFLIHSLFMSMFLYPVYGNWVWGGGWLSSLGRNFALGHGVVDFAGASVVHMTGGVAALAGTIVLGPRIGRFRRDGTVGIMPGHNLPMAMIGTLVLAFGWFGFNAGSTLAGDDPRIAEIAVNTVLASSSAALAALVVVWQRHRKPDIGMVCNGLLGGLVSITASCAFVTPPEAALIGIVAGMLVVWGVVLLEQRLRLDDPVGAIAVHGLCGAWGTLAVGIFADGTYGDGWNGVAGPVRGALFGDFAQLAAQVVGILVNATWVFCGAYGFFRLLERWIGNRVPADVETAGLDELEMGSDAYPHG